MTRRAFALFSLVASIFVASSCDKIPLFAPTASTITLTAPKRTLALNETVTVTAVVQKNSGQPVQNGTTVRFTTTLGSVSPISVETTNGMATAVFAAGTVSGIADVTATSGAAGGTTGEGANATATNVLKFTIGAADAQSVTIQAVPATVSSQGGTVTINAQVLGTNGQAITGVPVTFSADKGILSASTSTTDSTGVASVRLTTNVKTVVSATAAGKAAVSVTVDVLGSPGVILTCAGTAASATSCSQTVGQTVTFTAKKTSGSTAVTSSTLDFGDGTSVALGTLASDTTVSKTYSNAGAFNAVLRATDVNGETTSASASVTITARAPLSVNITATSSAAVIGVGQSWAFEAVVTPAADASSITSYVWTFGDGTPAVTTTGSKTNHIYTSNGPKTVTVTVTASDGRTATGQTQILVSGI